MSTRAQTLTTGEPARSASASAPPARRAGGSSLTKQWHGLPIWAWVVLGTVGGYLLWTRVIHKSSTSSSTTAAQSGAVGTGTTTPGGGKVHETFPTGGGYTGPASTAPPYPKSLSTAPATTSKTTPPKGTPIAGTFQRAPSFTPRASATGVLSPIKTWAQTLGLASKGTQVYLWTTSMRKPVPTTLAELKAIEHTGTPTYPQFTTYTKVTGTTSSPTRGVWYGTPHGSASGGSVQPGGTVRRVPQWSPSGQLFKSGGGVSGGGLTLNNQTLKVGNLVTDYGARTNPTTGTLRVFNTFAGGGATKQIQQRYTARAKQWVAA